MSNPKNSKRRRFRRMFSLEGLLGLFGLFSLGTGIWQQQMLQIFWGGIILAGLCLLAAVRHRNWDQHWKALTDLHRKSGRDPEG
jgi:hypothetical protein